MFFLALFSPVFVIKYNRDYVKSVNNYKQKQGWCQARSAGEVERGCGVRVKG